MRGRKERMVKVRALTPFSLGGGVDVEVGQVFEMKEDDAKEKLRLGWVEPPDAAADDENNDDEENERGEGREEARGGKGKRHPQQSRENVTTRDPATTQNQ